MTREELLTRLDSHEAVVAQATPFVTEQLALEEDEGGWTVPGAKPKASGKRHDQRHLREARYNELEVRFQRISEACQLARQEIDSGDGDKAMFFEHQAAQERAIVEPMLADLRMRAARTADGAQGGALTAHDVPDELIRKHYDKEMATNGVCKLWQQLATKAHIPKGQLHDGTTSRY